MKRFVRWVLLVGCIGILCIWGWSMLRIELIGYAFTDDTLLATQWANGAVSIDYDYSGRKLSSYGLIRFHLNNSVSKITSRMGFVSPRIINRQPKYISILIPYWSIFLPISLITLALWYRPIKAKLRGTDRQGFEVDLKTESKDQRQDADAAG